VRLFSSRRLTTSLPTCLAGADEPCHATVHRGPSGRHPAGIDAKHLNIDGDTTDEKLHHDKSWKTKIEEERDEPGDA
jgi:hypothetical protein